MNWPKKIPKPKPKPKPKEEKHKWERALESEGGKKRAEGNKKAKPAAKTPPHPPPPSVGASHGEGTPKGAPPPGSGTQRTRRLLFHEKFRWHTHHVRAIQADRILAEKRRRGWFSDYPEAGSNMYLLAPGQVYKVRVLASTVWVPEVRRWEPEVFIIGEGINFTVEDTTKLMQNLHRANVIAEQVGIRLYKE